MPIDTVAALPPGAISLRDEMIGLARARHVVGQHQRVAAHGVADMEADAVPLHLPAGEIEVALAYCTVYSRV